MESGVIPGGKHPTLEDGKVGNCCVIGEGGIEIVFIVRTS